MKMRRPIKYNAWVPELGLILNNVTLYANGQMGMEADAFETAIQVKNYRFYDEEVYSVDKEDGIDELIMSILPGEDWVYLEENQYIPLQFTGKLSIDKKEIFEGMIIRGNFNNSFRRGFVRWDSELLAFIFMSDGQKILLGRTENIEITDNKPELFKS
jgi:hypothetical protein